MTENISKRQARRERLGRRIWEIDFLRGICIVLMIWDHLWFLIYNSFGDVWLKSGVESAVSAVKFAKAYLESPLRTAAHPFVVVLFFALCGISCGFSKNNLKRGVLMAVFAGLITLVTYFMEIPIWFGALHLLAFSVLIWCAINFACRNKKDLTALVCFIVGTATIFIGILLWDLRWEIPRDDGLAFLCASFASDAYASYDYWPVFPNTGFMLIGAALGYWLYRDRKSLLPILSKPRWYAPVNFMGRIGLWVYVLHQVVFGTLLAIITATFIVPGNWVFF